MTSEPIVFEHTFDTPVGKVWKAITDPNEMKNWYFNLPGFKAEQGYQFQFTGGEEGGTQFLHLCEVTEVIPGKKLTYSWRYDGYPGNSWVTFELFDKGSQTLLILSHAGLESFPDQPEFAIENFIGGWTYIIHTSLKEYLDKK